MRRALRWLILLPLLSSSCWVTGDEVRRKVRQFDDDELETHTADTGV